MNPLREFTEALSERVKQTGSSGDEPAQVLLNAGNLKVTWSNGALRYIEAGDHELIRMIYPAVRDKDWLTVMPVIENENIQAEKNSFSIKIRCHYRKGEINFVSDYVIEGSKDNSISVTMEGQALEQFEKNRIGWCILHPIEGFAGVNCIIEHTNGSKEQSIFPEVISPQQVFTDIRSLSWIIERIHCKLDFEGDIFETEDQRNWTDSSFKTYSTPLSLPYPSTVEKGTEIFQKVIFRADGYFNAEAVPIQKTIIRLFPEITFRLPSIGICQRSGNCCPLSENEIKTLRAIRFDHYRVDLCLNRDGWQEEAERACLESLDLGYPVELALFFDDNYIRQITDFIKWYTRKKIQVSSILLFHILHPSTPDEPAREIIKVLRETDPDIKLATGTNANFAQINRNRPGDSGNDSVSFSIHPQEHLSDNATIVENLKAQEYAVLSAKKFEDNKEIIVSPVTIQRRFNANKTYVEPHWQDHGTNPQIDSRQMSLLGGCWTAISIKYLSEAGADSITYYETAGERGIIQGDRDSRVPSKFPSVSGMIYPIYHVFRFILGNKTLTGIKSLSSRPLTADCIALSDGKQARIILVNFTNSVQTLFLECCSGLFRIRTLCSTNYAEASDNLRWTGIENEKVIKSQNNFNIEPYSINLIEGWRKH